MSDRLLYEGHGIRVLLVSHQVKVLLSFVPNHEFPFVFPWNEVACALAMIHVEGTCDRCRQPIKDYAPPVDGRMTAGYYRNWALFMDPGEVEVCDACAWADPRYIAVYGRPFITDAPLIAAHGTRP